MRRGEWTREGIINNEQGEDKKKSEKILTDERMRRPRKGNKEGKKKGEKQSEE